MINKLKAVLVCSILALIVFFSVPELEAESYLETDCCWKHRAGETWGLYDGDEQVIDRHGNPVRIEIIGTPKNACAIE